VQVLLIRHAEAVDATPQRPDPARHLTGMGRIAARTLGERLRWYDCMPSVVWTSPLVRAAQTAEIVLAAMGWSGVIEALPVLAPGGDAHELEALLGAVAPDAVVMLFGHEPDISGLGSLLTRRADFPGLKKAQAARIIHGRVRWLFGPDDEAPYPCR